MPSGDALGDFGIALSAVGPLRGSMEALAAIFPIRSPDRLLLLIPPNNYRH